MLLNLPKINMDEFVDKERFIAAIKEAFIESNLVELWTEGKLLYYLMSPKLMTESIKEGFIDALLKNPW